jgi:hypothetical protein
MTQTEAPSQTDIIRIAVAQLNPTVGDIAGNLAKAREARADAPATARIWCFSPNCSSPAIRRKTWS